MDETCWCVYGGIGVRDVGTCLEKKKKKRGDLLGGTLCGKGVIIEVRPGMGGRVTLTGKSQRKNAIWWHRL